MGRKKRVILVGMILGALIAGAVMGYVNLNRALISLAEARATQRATAEISLALEEVMDHSFTYEDFIHITSDDTGAVRMLNANAVLMNQIASEASEAAQRRINSLEEEGIELPLGAALGASAFAGAGPKIHFRILPVGTVLTSFVTEFESAGINQTRHKIILEATATVRIVVPGGTRTASVCVTALMAESILVGDVPDSYIRVDETGDALNFLP